VRQHCAWLVRQPATLLTQLPVHPAVQYTGDDTAHTLLSEGGLKSITQDIIVAQK
jgi:hypothetical protein